MEAALISSFTLGAVSRIDIAPPLNLLYIASVLRRQGVDVHLLDLNLIQIQKDADPEKQRLSHIREQLSQLSPTMIGISCLTTAHFSFMRQVAIMARDMFPAAKIILGGVHATLFAKEILHNCPEFDYIILGEGEDQIAALAKSMAEDALDDVSHIQSFAWRTALGDIVLNKRQNYIENLDSVPFPAWDLVNFSEYYRDHSQWYNPRGHDIKISIPIMATRSCPYNCNFCSAHKTMGRGFRKRTPENVVNEMQFHVDTYGHRYFGFVDDNLTLEKKYVMAVCNEIVRRKLDIQFESYNGYNIASIDEDIIHALTSAGCVYVILPVEHGSDWMRNTIIGKKLPREKIFDVMRLYKKYHLLTRAMFIMGFPEDTPETLADTVKIIEELKPDMTNVFNLIPFPGTKVFQQCYENDLFLGSINEESLWTGEMALDTKKGDFYIKPYNMSLTELMDWRQTFDNITTDLLEKRRAKIIHSR